MNVNRVEKQTLEIPLWSAFLYVHNNFTSYKRPSKTSGKAPTFTNKKFLETDYPRGRAVEVFRRTDSYRYHFGLRAKTEILYFAPPGNPEAEPSGNYKD